MRVVPNTFNCTNLGNNIVTLTTLDRSGNFTSATAIVTVLDTLKPNTLTRNVTVYVNSSGTVSITPAQVNNGSNDNCAIDSIRVVPNTFNCTNLGNNTVTLTTFDRSGNTSSATATVTVLDTISPVTTVRNIVVYLSASGTASITPAQVNNGSTDNCAIDSMRVVPNTFNCLNVGYNIVQLTTFDRSGNFNSAPALVTVLDTIRPVTTARNITVYVNSSGNVTITPAQVNNGSNDNCSIDSMRVVPNSFSCSNLGNNTVTLTSFDRNGNSSSATATVTVLDTLKPSTVTRNITAYLNSSGTVSIVPAQVNNGSTDNCAIDSMYVIPNTFNCSKLGTNSVNLTTLDRSGNFSSASATVTVRDTIKPVALASGITIYVDTTGRATITPTSVNSGSSDNCGIKTMTVTPNLFTCSMLGANVVTLTVEDFDGNISTDTCIVVVNDTIAPIARAKDTTIYLNANGFVAVTPQMVDNGTLDYCNVLSATVSPTMLTCSNRGPNTVTYTVTDKWFNTTVVTSTVTVLDTIRPRIQSRSVTVYLNSTGQATLSVNTVDSGTSDNCAIRNRILSQTLFDCSHVGVNSVVFTVDDSSGNVSQKSVLVTVLDTISPRVITRNATIYLSNSGVAMLTPSMIDSASTDNCSGVNLLVSKSVFSCSDKGNNLVLLTVRDSSGNTKTGVANVVVLDTVAPRAILANRTAYLTPNGFAVLNGWMFDSASTDNCGIKSFSVNPDTLDCSKLGFNTVQVTIMDSSNNAITISAGLQLIDTIGPTVLPRNAVAYLNSSGFVRVNAAMFDSASFDNCTSIIREIDKDTFTCSSVGLNQVVLKVTDVFGNFSTATAWVQIRDTVSPVVRTSSPTLYLNASGVATLSTSAADSSTTDACGIQQRVVSPATFTCNELGLRNYTLTVTDVNGNSSSKIGQVLVLDTIGPKPITRPVTVYLNGQGRASLSALVADSASTDNCSIASRTISPDTLTCMQLGITSATLTLTDQSGNSRSAATQVTVVDTIKPTARAKDISVYLNLSGTASVTGAMLDSASTDNCTIATRTANPAIFGCNSTGMQIVVLSVSDQSGNTSYDTAVVHILDTIKPIISTRPATVYLNANGLATLSPAQVDSNTTDPCGVDSIWVVPQSFSCSSRGINTARLFARDRKGNIGSATAQVFVADTIKPVIRTRPATVYLNATGVGILTTNSVDSGSTDNCSIGNRTLSKASFNCTNLGVNLITYSVSDSSGNTSQSPVQVTVLDTVRPVAQLRTPTVYLNSNGIARFSGNIFDSASFDNCSIQAFTVTPDSFTCSAVGINPVTVSLTDQSGNIRSVSAFVRVQDTLKPVVRTRTTVVYLNSSGVASVNAAQVDSSSSDNCSIATREVKPATFTCVAVGNNTVTLIITDVYGNKDSAVTTVQVRDTIKPLASARPLVRALNSSGFVKISGNELDSGSADVCGIASFRAIPDSFTCANTGLNSIVLKVTDLNGNVAYDTATVLIRDTILPRALPRLFTAYLQSNGKVTVNAASVDSASSDKCGIASFALQPDTFSCAQLGFATANFRVTDVNGNVSVATATIRIVDTTAPVAVLRPVAVYLNAAGSAQVTASQVDSASRDNCTLASVVLNRTQFGCGDKGAQTVIATLTDQSGNKTQAQTVVHILDTIRPKARPKQLITTYVNGAGQATVTPAMLDSASSDNCGVAQRSLNKTVFSCSDVGINRVVLSVIDSSGNSDSAAAFIRVLDTIAPRPSLVTVTAYLNTAGNVTVTGAQFNQASVDNCEIDSIAINRSVFTCNDIGNNRVFVTVFDKSRNSASDSATIIVRDTISPKPICPPAQTIYTTGDTCGRIFVLPTPPVLNIDNCSVLFSSNAPANNFYALGTTSVTWVATDLSGNTGSCIQQVTVRDTVSPVVRTRQMVLYLSASGVASITPQQLDSASTDACGIDSLYLSQSDFNCSHVGTNIIRLFARDNNRNIGSAIARVHVIDTVRPILLGRNVVTYLNASGTVTVPASFIDNGSNDACGTVNISLSDSVFTCSDVGMNTVNFRVTDVNGNFIEQPFTIEVLDTIKPVARAKNLSYILVLPDNSKTITVPDADNGSSDACGIDSMWLSETTFTISNLGNNIVVLFVRDKNGNLSTDTFNVFIEERNPPVARCKSFDVVLVNGWAYISADMVNDGSTDETGIASYTIDRDSFSCANIGNNSVKLTVTDVHGLVSTCTATINVIGTIPNFSPFAEIDKNGPVIGIPDVLPNPNQMYLGYGPQTMKLGITTTDERPLRYLWEGEGILNITDSTPTYVPVTSGIHKIKAIVKNVYGCINSASVEVCVLDVRDPRPEFNLGEKQVVVCMKPLKNMSDSFSVSVPISEVASRIALGGRIGHCDMRCGGQSNDELITDNMTYDAVLYPNPSNYTLNLKIVTTQINARFDFTVFNINGKVVYEKFQQDPFNVISFGEDFEAGLYVVEVKYVEDGREFIRRYKAIKVN
ncbi:MAG: T9SS type A sorting domain-containing protein [Bacteroidota bacterium]